MADDAPRPPFRADQVGSLLRPAPLRAAHEAFLRGSGDAVALRELQDRCILEAIRLQEDVGLHAITDGEFRRTSFHADFIEKLDGAKASGRVNVEGTASGLDAGKAVADKPFAPRAFAVTGRLLHARPIEAGNFAFVHEHTGRTAKQTIPSPTMLLRGGRAAVSREAYPDLDEFHADIAAVYREELRQLAAAGCRYLQLDDTNFAYLCDAKLRDTFRRDGYDPAEMPDRFARLINAVAADRPVGMTLAIHLCRGNSVGQWAAQGGYEPVAGALFNDLDVDAFFLEYDDQRSGGFEPLRHFPRGSRKRIVLGLVSTKTAALESADALARRIDAAARYVPLENLCLSPQCGFSSTFRGNPLGEDAQRRKLERVVEAATKVWGTAR